MPRPILRSRGPVIDASARSPTRTRWPEIAPWGFDLSGMNRAVRAGDSLYEYANGGWLTRNTIPADRTYWSATAELRVRTEERVQELIEQQPDDAPAGSDARKVRDYYRAFCDSARIEARGLAPAQPALARIARARTHGDIAALMARAELGLPAPLQLQIVIDDKNPERQLVAITQAGLGLPDRDYYLSARHLPLRAAYLEHIAHMLSLSAGRDTQASARAVLALETRMAELHWPAQRRREREATYNLRSRTQLEQLASAFPWRVLFGEAGLAGHDAFVVAELDAIEQLLALFVAVPVADWRSYLSYHYLAAHAALLPSAFDEAHFALYGRALHGLERLLSRDKRAVAAVNETLGEAVGKLYVERWFPPSYKQATLSLVESLRAIFASRLRELPWMTKTTKQAAQRKLEALIPKVGYPDKWRDYSELQVRADDAFGNAVRARVWHWQAQLARLRGPTDRSEWSMPPQTVNACYEYTLNEIVFPAAILQPPFFDPHADPAVNYGAIGAVIGHEMGHGFDDQGAKSDERGVLRTWWQSQDEQAFQRLVDALVEQYDAYEALPGIHVNGRLTVGENIGDLGGLSLAYAAFRAQQRAMPSPRLDNLSADQRFFLAWAQIWRQLRREESQRNLLLSDPHSPSRLRVDAVVRNMDAFYTAFDVRPTDTLWLDPRARVSIW